MVHSLASRLFFFFPFFKSLLFLTRVASDTVRKWDHCRGGCTCNQMCSVLSKQVCTHYFSSTLLLVHLTFARFFFFICLWIYWELSAVCSEICFASSEGKGDGCHGCMARHPRLKDRGEGLILTLLGPRFLDCSSAPAAFRFLKKTNKWKYSESTKHVTADITPAYEALGPSPSKNPSSVYISKSQLQTAGLLSPSHRWRTSIKVFLRSGVWPPLIYGARRSVTCAKNILMRMCQNERVTGRSASCRAEFWERKWSLFLFLLERRSLRYVVVMIQIRAFSAQLTEELLPGGRRKNNLYISHPCLHLSHLKYLYGSLRSMRKHTVQRWFTAEWLLFDIAANNPWRQSQAV